MIGMPSPTDGFGVARKSTMRAPKARKFYRMDVDCNIRGFWGLIFENEKALFQPGQMILGPERGKRGFPKYSEMPRFRFDPKKGRWPYDIELYSEYWLVSERAKNLFESVDPLGFTFAQCEVVMPNGTRGQTLWFCDVVRVLAALDETASDVKITEVGGEKYYDLSTSKKLIFYEQIVGNDHVFRIKTSDPDLFCDWTMRDACKAAKLKGVVFYDAIQK